MSDFDTSRRTEKPTPKRKEDFRKKGHIANSRDVLTAACLMGGAAACALWLPASIRTLSEFGQIAWGNLSGVPTDFFVRAGHVLLLGCAPISLGATGLVLVAGGAQLGWPPALRWPRPSLKPLLTGDTMRRLLSPKEVATRTLFAALKFTAVAIPAGMVLHRVFAEQAARPSLSVRAFLWALGQSSQQLIGWALVTLLGVALLDCFKARWQWLARLRMTREEVRREVKEQEGDPQMKLRRRRRMRDIARRALPQKVAKADVVLVNPTEFAVALRYATRRDRAPKVVAKGRGTTAEWIRQLARRGGIPIMERPPLARALYRLVPEGREIPTVLYQAVAEVLAYVYRLRGGRKP